MQPHVKTYMEYFGYGVDDFIKCTRCPEKAVDIHHIVPRSKFGKKKANECNNIHNIIALCRNCHNMAHEEMITKKELLNLQKEKLGLVKRK